MNLSYKITSDWYYMMYSIIIKVFKKIKDKIYKLSYNMKKQLDINCSTVWNPLKGNYI